MTEQTTTRRFDVVSWASRCCAWAMMPIGAQLDATQSLDLLAIGGARKTMCVALARLGRRTGWVGRLPEHALARAIMRTYRADGVDVSAVRRVPNERLGTYFIEYATQPRAIQVICRSRRSAAAHDGR
ncbi:MAG: PfkB family carbohydrate kinase [Kouleothrix sp.]